MRKTGKTVRRLPGTARELAKLGNELDRISRRLHTLTERVSAYEAAAVALDRYMVNTASTAEGETA